MAYYNQSDLLPNVPHYGQPQYGNSDQLLESTTPGGYIPASDPDNDTRDSYQYKSDLQQAYSDTSDPTDTHGYHVSAAGNRYEAFDNSRQAQQTEGILSYVNSWLMSNGDWQLAASRSYQTLDAMDAKQKRYSQIDSLESKGYNPVDISSYLETGDRKALVANKGEWTVAGGMLVNKLTSEVKPLPQTAAQQETERHNRATEDLNQQKYNREGSQVDHSVDEGNTIHIFYKDGTDSYEPKGMTDYQQERINVAHQKLAEGRQEQVSATATNAKQAEAFGKDITLMEGLDYAGPGWANRISAGYQGGVHNANPLAPVNAKVSQYNNNLKTLGNSSLYTESGGKRIFAKEMENAGKKFIELDTATMNKQQIKDAIENNNEIIRMYYDWENRILAGKNPVAPSTETQYPQGQKNPTPRANGGNAPQAAIDFLRAHPEKASQFKAKYGYLPQGY